jgi:hypothetical protein
MKRLTLALITTATLTACAPGPNAITPVSMAGAFDATSCATARQMLATEQATLATLSDQQREARTADTIGVLLIGIPASSALGGDKSGLIAASKGKVAALEQRLLACG